MAHENDGHRARLRERMMKEGLDNFQDHEMLELLLFQSIPRRDTNKIAHTLLNTFGDFSDVINATPAQLMTVKGISEVTACNLSMLKDVFVRYRRCQANKMNLHSLDSILQYAHEVVADSYYERLIVIYVDHATNYKYSQQFTSGKIDKVNVEPRDIVSTAIRVDAAGVILAHCHANGKCEPSDADIDFTKQLFVALASMNLVLLEHVIFNNTNEYFSFYKEGYISEIELKYKESF